MNISSLPGFKYLARNNSYIFLFAVGLIVVIGVLLSILNWRAIYDRSVNSSITKYDQSLNQSKLIINEKLNEYSLLLNDGTSLLTLFNNNITQAQWLTFFQSYNLPANYPGVDAVSFSQYVSASNLNNYLTNISAQGEPNFNITPAGARSIYAPITYIGYASPTSLKALGYDQLSDPIRAEAMLRARDSGQVTMTSLVHLIAVNKLQPSVLIYKPVYNGPTSTLEQRQSSIFGFVFIAINSNDFFNALLSHYLNHSFALQIFDGSEKSNNLLYETPDFNSTMAQINNPITSQVNTSFGGKTWDIKVITSRSIILVNANESGLEQLIIGLVITFIVASLLMYFAYYRERHAYWQRQRAVQMAKDELISLASHQLRTPATIVKQYLGILLQNYVGGITEKQRQLIQTAYDSNERQLQIADQFLNAAKLGSGRIKLSKSIVDINDILSDVVNSQQLIANNKKQKINLNMPKTKYQLKADPKYLPIVFENLISNSIKYSNMKTTITINLRKHKNEITVSVIDHGRGIPKEEMKLVFEKFSRSDSTDGNGTGVGLYLVEQIVRMHSGRVTAKSQLGKGSEFTVHLPYNVS
ncbi:MAG: CHASE domain-containing sensor histidine kinase [Candidatus Saccharimonadales bacterium]